MELDALQVAFGSIRVQNAATESQNWWSRRSVSILNQGSGNRLWVASSQKTAKPVPVRVLRSIRSFGKG